MSVSAYEEGSPRDPVLRTGCSVFMSSILNQHTEPKSSETSVLFSPKVCSAVKCSGFALDLEAFILLVSPPD